MFEVNFFYQTTAYACIKITLLYFYYAAGRLFSFINLLGLQQFVFRPALLLPVKTIAFPAWYGSAEQVPICWFHCYTLNLHASNQPFLPPVKRKFRQKDH
jgi:hypothetical protein